MACGERGGEVLKPASPVGYVLAGEEHSAADLVRHGAQAEKAGLSFLFVSDHFHPWNSQQGHGSSIWPVLGALATSTRRALLISAVVCPILRWHVTTLAQAAATVATLSEGRFVLGLGTGENLNEHVVGEGWPPFKERLERLEEAVSVLRELLSGVEVTHKGKYFSVDRAQLFDSVPDLPIALAASGRRAAALAGRLGDGLICLGEDADSLQGFHAAGGDGKPRLTQISICWAADQAEARRTAHRLWPVVALEGSHFSKLATPAEVEEACAAISEQDVAAAIVCGPDPSGYREVIDGCLAAGFDGVALHQIGPDQDGFFEFWRRELAPLYGR